MTLETRFSLIVRRTPLLEITLDEPVPRREVPTVSELDACGFSLSIPEQNTEYQIRIGDEVPDEPFGEDFGNIVLWRHTSYFESARGRVRVFLLSKETGVSLNWRERAEVMVNVLPAKLGEERYDAMLEDLRAVSVGLVFDLLSKSRLNLALVGIGAISSRPANAELMVLERLWSAVSYTLRLIAVQPMTGLRMVREEKLCWGSERLGGIGLRKLAATGVDPRRADMPRPFYATRELVRETFDIPEHRTIVGFLRFLRERVADCGRRASEHIEAIKGEQPFRDIGQHDGSNLFRDVDSPRMERLLIAMTRASDLMDRIRNAEQLEFLRGVRGEMRMPQSPVSFNLLPYRRFRDEMLRYLGASLAILDEGIEERAKSTGRMYEQWIFLQVLAALRACGLSPLSQERLLTRSRSIGSRSIWSAEPGSSLVVRMGAR